MGTLFIISGPSGVGKSTIRSEILKSHTNLWYSISMTTREKRDSEVDGEDYFFVSEEEFVNNIKQDNFFEYIEVYQGLYYGTPKDKVLEKLRSGVDVILEIDIEGAKSIKKIIPEAIFIFIMPPSLKVIAERLKKRGTDSKERMLERFHIGYKEINEVTKYNYVVVNDVLEDAIDKVEAIIKSEKCRVDRIEEVYLDTKEEEIHELLMDKEFINEDVKI